MNREKILGILESHRLTVGHREGGVTFCTCGAVAASLSRGWTAGDIHREHLAVVLERGM